MIKIATKGEKGSAIVASTTKAVTKLAEKGKQLTTKVAAKAKKFKKQVNTAIAQAKQNGRKQLDHLQSALQGNRQNDFALAGGGKLVTQTTRKEKPTDTLVQASSGKGSSSTKGTGNNSKGVEGTNKFKFVENAKNHLINVENVNTKKGIVGGHNMDEFNKALKSQGFNPND